jgi:hypothetical protein
MAANSKWLKLPLLFLEYTSYDQRPIFRIHNVYFTTFSGVPSLCSRQFGSVCPELDSRSYSNVRWPVLSGPVKPSWISVNYMKYCKLYTAFKGPSCPRLASLRVYSSLMDTTCAKVLIFSFCQLFIGTF